MINFRALPNSYTSVAEISSCGWDQNFNDWLFSMSVISIPLNDVHGQTHDENNTNHVGKNGYDNTNIIK